ncbi:DoxX family membrane protein [Rhodophyticola sp. CCM32]|uniref:DoxX family membrane protein n=1 Tax=Rhodophyticola sp. CCM32 TaxID=2916397 RepID=UPI00107F368B|nr:DoxX family membrane protein [Rhodophyticola sp. CCM32]QBX99563.1 DoxX family membrane protein [Rhodophyticola sp. CCM32]
MNALISLHNRFFTGLEALVAPALIPTLARLVFAATLLFYYWNSAMTKLGDGFFGFYNVDFGAYTQITPRLFEAAGYDPGQMGFLVHILVVAATIGEFTLPFLLLIGLLTRLAALGMIGFVVAQSWVDIFGHGIGAEDIGTWFDGTPGSLILDQRAFWVFVLLVLVFRGAGPLSVDALLRGRMSAT